MNDDQIDALERRNKMREELILEKLDNIEKKTDEIKALAVENARALRGHNGTPGLVSTVEVVKKDVESNCQKIEEVADRRIWVNRAVIVAALAMLADVIYGLLTRLGQP